MRVYTITPKGQVTIPLEIRNKLKLKPGDKISYQQTERGVILKPAKEGMLRDFGFLKDRSGTTDTSTENIRKNVREKIGERRQSK